MTLSMIVSYLFQFVPDLLVTQPCYRMCGFYNIPIILKVGNKIAKAVTVFSRIPFDKIFPLM